MSDISGLTAALADRYRIERELGTGGMATVFLARDLKHDRDVALKVLKPELAAVLGAERFVVEIKTTASLQHPHILPLFDSGTAGGFLFYVMPYIAGETIREKLNRETQFGVDEAVRIAREIADALDYAHRHGVIHRDIKPENILLHDGRAMVMDFGIALAVSAAAGGRMTETGLSLGTPHYMSPEQATAEKEITPRSDVYSLASVLYEMLTGDPPFVASSAQAVIMKIITDTARPLRELRKNVPPNIEAAVAKALEKLPADRFESAKAFGDALANPSFTAASASGMVAGAHAARAGVSPRKFAITAAVAVVAVIAALWGWLVPAPKLVPRVLRFPLNVPENQRFADVSGIPIVFSPDGKAVVYSGRSNHGTQLYYRPLDQLQASALPGTENASQPFMSPDGEWVGFVSAGKISKVSVHGGAASTITADYLFPRGLAWGRNDIIVIGSPVGLFRVSASGGTPERLTTVDVSNGEIAHQTPLILPDGKSAIFWVSAQATGQHLSLIRFADKAITVIEGSSSEPIALIEGILFFAQSNGSVSAVKFDPATTRSLAAATQVLDGVMYKAASGGALSVSDSGDLAYVRGSASNVIVVLDEQGRRVGGSPDQGLFLGVRFSPDGRRIAVYQGSVNLHADVYFFDIASGVLQRVTTKASSFRPAWSPDGRRIAYIVQPEKGLTEARWAPADGSGAEERLVAMPIPIQDIVFSPDARYAVLTVIDPKTRQDLYLVDLKGDRKPVPIVQSEFIEKLPAISPDGHWLAYESDESGVPQVYVRPFPNGGARVQVSSGGGREPHWTRDSRALMYIGAERLVKAHLAVGAGISVVHQDTLFEHKLVTTSNTSTFDIAPNGNIVVVRSSTDDADVIVVSNWLSEVKARLAVKRK